MTSHNVANSVRTNSVSVNISTRVTHLLRWLEDVARAREHVLGHFLLPECEVPSLADARSVATRLHELARLSYGVLYATDADLVEHSGASPRTVQRTLRTLAVAELVERVHGGTAYWTHRAYGGRARLKGNYRVLVLRAWCPQLASSYGEAVALAERLARPFDRAFGPVGIVATVASVIPLKEGSPAERFAALAGRPPRTDEAAAWDRYQEGEHTEGDRWQLADAFRVHVSSLARVGQLSPYSERARRENALKTALARMRE